MLRYCTYCKKEFDFPPMAVSGKEILICPECGKVIDKNSRRPVDQMAEKTEEDLGKAVGWFFRFIYVFYLLLGIAGVIGFISGTYGLLYITTGISLLAYVIQFITGTTTFSSGVIFLPAGATIGYLIFGDIKGVCLGIHVVFLIRHLLRDIVYTLIFKLVKMG